MTVQGLHVSARLGTCLLWYKFGEHLNGLTETGEHLLYSFSSGNCDVVDILSLYIFNSKYCPSVKYIPMCADAHANCTSSATDFGCKMAPLDLKLSKSAIVVIVHKPNLKKSHEAEIRRSHHLEHIEATPCR